MTPLDTLFERDFEHIIKQTRVYPLPKKPAIPKLQTESHFAIPSFRNEDSSCERNDSNIVARIFYPLILVGKYLGICPVQISKLAEDKCLRYNFKYISVPFISSIFVCFFNLFILICWIYNALLDQPGPFGLQIFKKGEQGRTWLSESLFQGSQLISIINILVKLSLPFGAWVLVFLQILNMRPLCKFLNGWSGFLRDYESCFSLYYSHKFHKTLTIHMIIFSVIWASPVVAILLSFKSYNVLVFGSTSLGVLFSFIQVTVIVGTRALTYLRDMILLRTLILAYEEILNGIRAEYGKCRKSITKAQVSAWVDLISFTRVQAARVESYISLPNLWSIFEVFISVLLLLSLISFVFLNNVLVGDTGTNFLPYTIVYTSFFVCSLFWKTYLAENLSVVEEAIAEEMIEMDTADDDFETRLEMKLICELIYNDPVKIKVGNMIVLNKRLLLTFFSQIASYLVVILQFTKS